MCGLWGFASKNTKKFDWTKFDWIGVGNDKRGRDACGRICGDFIEHSNSHVRKEYKDYISINLPPRISKDVKAIFGHTRMSSRAHGNNNNIEYTQPIVFYDDNEEIEFIASHNGTLFNHKELQKEYGFEGLKHKYIKDDGEIVEVEMNDSQILFHIIGRLKKYDVLTKYVGGTAFALYNYKDNELLLWSGSSKITEYGNEREERPIHVLQEKDHLWFSSEYEPLSLINYNDKAEPEELANNILHFYKDGILTKTESYDRSECYQFDRKEMKKGINASNQCNICNGTGFTYNNTICYSCKGSGLKYSIASLPAKPVQTAFDLFDEEIPGANNQLIKYVKANYWLKGKLAHGIYHLDTLGCHNDDPVDEAEATHDWQITKPYYFILGNMMKGAVEFNKWSRRVKVGKTLNSSESLQLAGDTEYPVFSTDLNLMKTGEWSAGWNFNGSISPLFSQYEYSFLDGKLKSKSKHLSLREGTPDHGEVVIPEKKVVSDLPFDNVNEDDSFHEIIQSELLEGFEMISRAIRDVQNITFQYSEHALAKNAYELLTEMEEAIANTKI